MTLDERMGRARADYRALEAPDRAVVAIDLDRRRLPGEGRRGRWMLAVAALVAAVVGAAAVATTVDDDPATEVAEGTTSTSTTTVGTDRLVLWPDGPYVDGEEVTVGHPADLGEEVRVVECAEVAAVETCGLTIGDPQARPGSHGTVLELRRLLLTPEGTVDCADDGVTCRLVALDEQGGRIRSDRLRFSGDGFDVPTLAIEPAGEPGTFTVRPGGLTPHLSWTENRGTIADDVGAFTVQLCSFGPTEPTPGPFGEDLWDQPVIGPGEAACGAEALDVAIDPDDPDAALTVTLPTEGYGDGGWFDCRAGGCFLDISRTVVTDPGGSGWTERATAGLVPPGVEWPDPVRPSLTVETPGPHRVGQIVAVTIAGLPPGRTTAVAVCHVTAPWGCSSSAGAVGLGDGTHQVPLLDQQLVGCGPEDCYLQLDAGRTGLPPLAMAPLDTPG